LFFSILAILCGATSYRKAQAFIKTNYAQLDETFALNWNTLSMGSKISLPAP
jgi:hypothetical protein